MRSSTVAAGTFESPNWVQQVPRTAPTPTAYGNAAFDPLRNQVVAFGGETIELVGSVPTWTVIDETWVWAAQSQTWVQQSPAASPAARAGASMAWDPDLNEIILFGGVTAAGVPLNDLWAWDGSNWSQLTPSGSVPAARWGASMAWDADRDGLVLFAGGSSSTSVFNDTWLFSGSSWRLVQGNGAARAPAARAYASMAYSTASSQLVLFAGLSALGTSLSDTWVLGTTGWVQQNPATAPPARYLAGMVDDPGLGSTSGIVLFGGYHPETATAYSDTWAWDGSTWLSAPTIAAPSARYAFAMAATDSGQVIITGGTSGSRLQVEQWLYDSNVPVLSVSAADSSAGAQTGQTGDSITVTIYAENVGKSPVDDVTVTSPLSQALQASGSLVTWAGVQLTACSSGMTTVCGAIIGLSATISHVTLAPGFVETGSYVATVVGSVAGCSLLSIPVTASNEFGTAATARTNLSSCAGGLGDEDWWSYDTTDLGEAGSAKVNVANGNLLVKQTDSTQMTSHGQLGFDIARAYNSQDDVATPGPIGTGWQFDLGRTGVAAAGGMYLGSLKIPVLQSAPQPLSVTYIDRDGTRQVFKLRSVAATIGPISLNALANSPLKPLFKLLDPLSLPFGLTSSSYNTLCLDATYSAPAGVDEYMFRYIGVLSSTCSGAETDTGAITVGWSVVRPDRLRYDFNPQGHLLDVMDGTGHKLVYKFDELVRPTEVYSASCVPSDTVSTSPIQGPSCPFIQIDYSTVRLADGTERDRVDVTDPAKRVTTYIVSRGILPLLQQVWNPDDPFSTAPNAAPSISYTYSTAASPCPGSAAGVTTVALLCSVTDSDDNMTTFGYTPSPIGPDRVLSITDARANATNGAQGSVKLFTYHDDSHSVTVDTAASSVMGTAVPATGCVGNAACERTRYVGIDSRGRVSEIDDGNAADMYLHQQGFFWDGTAAYPSCEQPGDVVDNNLCETITRAVPSNDPFTPDGVGSASVNGVNVNDHAVRYQYGDMGQLLRKSVLVDPSAGWTDAGTDVTTYGSHEQYFDTDNSVRTYDDSVEGDGQVTSTSPAASGAYAAAVTQDGPTSFYRFDETSGATLHDVSGHSHNGTYTSGVHLAQTGRVDDAVDEMGGSWTATAGISGFASGVGSSSAFSVEYWIKTTDTGAVYQMAEGPSINTYLAVGQVVGGLPTAALVSDAAGGEYASVIATQSVADGEWHQIDVTYSGGGHAADVNIYVDGQKSTTVTYSDTLAGAFTSSTGTVGIGDVADVTGDDANVQVDELALFATALTGQQIGAHYAAATGNTRANATTLYAVEDQTEMLPPRGNKAGVVSHWGDFLTRYRRDIPAEGTAQDSYPRPYQTAAAAVCGSADTGNTGLLCETDTPASAGVAAGDCQSPITGAAGSPPTGSGYAHTCTTETYNQFGERTSQTSPDAHAATPTGRSTVYDYYGDTGSCSVDPNSCDLSGHVSIGGMLKAVTDPADNSVVYAYDRAGNVARTWSRNATQGQPLSASWSSAGSPPSTQYTEIDHANPVTSALLSASAEDTEVVTSDGLVHGSGANTSGQLGDGSSTPSATPVAAAGLSDVVEIAQTSGTSCQYTLARTGNGSVYQWGGGVSTPTKITGLPPVIGIAAGGYHLLALDSSGRVWAWGSNGSGQLGDGTTTSHTTPVQVLTGVAAIAAGGTHSLAVKTDGSVWAWGSNGSGQLGDGTTSSHSSPTRVNTLSRALAVAAGTDTSYAISSDGTVWSWGSNTDGALGTGSTDGHAATPQLITGLDARNGTTAVRQIAAADHSAAALMSNGTIRAWGDNSAGQLADATTAGTSTTPVTVPNLTGQVALAGNDDTYLSATAAGTVSIWGDVSQGQTGDDSTPAAPVTPQHASYSVSPFAAPWRYVQGTRDAVGNLSLTTTDAIGQVMISRPARGTAVLTTAYDSTMSYDPDGNQLTSLAPGERSGVHQSSSSYDPFGNPTITIDANGNATVTDFDTLNRPVDVKTTRATSADSTGSGCSGGTAASGGPWTAQQIGHTICETSATYDGNDLQLTATDALGQTTSTGYDGAGRKISSSVPRTDGTYTTLTTRWNYDPDGNITDVCPPRQFDAAHEQDTTAGCTSTGAYSTHFSYDNADSPTTVTVYRVTGASSATPETTSTSYDADGNAISVTDANGHKTTSSYDLLDRKISQHRPSAGTTTWKYDASGNVTAILAPGARYTGSGKDGALVVDGASHPQSNPYQIPDGAEYTDVTLQNGGWVTSADPHGLVFYASGTVDICATCGIDESGKGYAGGAGASSANHAGANADNPVTVNNGNGGLGGGGSAFNSGAAGGGGGHRTAGGTGLKGNGTGVPGQGGAPSGTADFSDVGSTYLLGSGGGGGGGGDGFTLLKTAGHGGNGGGFVHIIANAITLNGTINANGATGGTSTSNAAGGGGGAGGGIWLDAATISPADPSANLDVAGGAGGGGAAGANGGAGAPGYTLVQTAATLAGQKYADDITAYSYDADNRVLDTVRGAQTLTADPSTDPDAKPDANGWMNQRSRNVYDPDGHVVVSLPPLAFNTTAALTDPNLNTATRTDYNLDGQPSASYDPRYNDSNVADVSSGGDGGTSSDQQTAECPTGADPDLAAGLPGYGAAIGVCVTRSQYDPDGNFTRQDLPAPTGNTSRYLGYTYTDDDLPLTATAPDPDGSGRVTAHRYLYDGDGRQISDTDANGDATVTGYTADGLTREIDDQPYTLSGTTVTHKTLYRYDADGNQISVQDPDAQDPAAGMTAADYTTTSTWTSDGLQASIRRPGLGHGDFDTTTYTYDAVGNPVTVTSPSANAADASNPVGLPTVYTFTADDLISSSSVPVSAGSYRTTLYGYTPSGQKATVYVGTCAVSDPSTCRPDAAAWTPGGVTQYGYAPDGLNIHQVGRDLTNGQPGTRTITTSYDQAGRPVAVADNTSNVTVSARYYLDGLLRSVDDGTDTSTYAYTGTGRVSVRTDHTGSAGVTGGVTKVTSYAYNDAGLPARMSSDVTGTAASWSYDPAGRPTGRVDTNGSGSAVRTTAIGYNPDDTLASYRTSAGGSTVAADAYTYDDDGNILTHAVSGSAQSFTNSYSYNPAGNLTGFTQNRGGSSTNTSYGFDHDANRLSSTSTGGSTVSTTWTYRADDSIKTAQTSGQGLLTFAYSAAGELTDDGCFAYGYDEFSRTRTSSLDTGAAASCGRAGTATYTYDGLDRQQQVTVTGGSSNGTTHNSYDGLSSTLIGQAGALTGSGSTPQVLYALNPDGAAVAYTQSGSGAGAGSVFLDQDGYGNITSLLGAGSTSSACAVDYDPYGNPLLGTTPPANGNGVCASGAAAASTGNSIWYRGQNRSFTTGSYQLGLRTYQPALGSFTTPDTYRVDTPATDLSVGTDPLTENTYSYVNGNPVNFTDPNGHDPANHECDTSDMVQCHDYSYGGNTYSHGKANRVNLPDNFNVKAARACDWESACFETQPTKSAAGPGYNPAPGSLVPHRCDSLTCLWNDFKDLVGISAVESCISSHSVGSCVKAAVAVGAVACSVLSGGSCKVITAVVGKFGEAADFTVGTAGVEAADAAGIVTYEGGGFSASELDAASSMARNGNSVVLRTADPKAGRMSDLLVNGTPYDVYTPEAGTSVRNILSNTASKWTQVNGGGVVVDLRGTGLSASTFGNALARVNGFVGSWGGTPLSDVRFINGG
jgi:RHS repeat-associated protein